MTFLGYCCGLKINVYNPRACLGKVRKLKKCDYGIKIFFRYYRALNYSDSIENAAPCAEWGGEKNILPLIMYLLTV
ncbi:hypothetical protein JCM17380_53500 [Desulfosporosinus burensis]